MSSVAAAVPVAPPRALRVTEVVFRGLVVLFAGTALAAYTLGPIPAPWLAQGGLVALAVALVLGRDRVMVVPGGAVLAAFLAWALAVNVLQAGRYASLMPLDATLPYPLYLAVRYVGIFSFAAAFYLALWVMYRGYAPRLVNAVVLVGVCVALFSFYVYAAHILGLPEPPRNRMSTGGSGPQATLFSSGGTGLYRRMLGPFREPSQLAEWILIPLFFSFARKGRLARTCRACLTAALVLTVSMGGMVSACAGAVLGLLLTNPLRAGNRRRVLVVLVGATLLGVAAGGITVGAGENATNILSVLTFRIDEIMEGGIGKSNRGYVVDFMVAQPPPPLGYGMGNANIVFSEYTGSKLPMSFLSLYVNVLYSAGVVGLVLLLAFMAAPVLRAVRARGETELGTTPVFLMAYLAHMVAYSVNSEELTIPFAVAAAVLVYQVGRGRPPPSGVPDAAPPAPVLAAGTG